MATIQLFTPQHQFDRHAVAVLGRLLVCESGAAGLELVMPVRHSDSVCVLPQAFADTIFEIWQPGDVIWIHDYHLMMVPQMLRKKLRDVRLGFFLHTPYPTCVNALVRTLKHARGILTLQSHRRSEVYRVLPFRQQILEALLTCDLVGFHCFSYARHFLRSCSEILGLEVSPKVS